MFWFTVYFLIGLSITVIGLTQLHFSRQSVHGAKAVISLTLGALLWPLALGGYWYSRQQDIWKTGPQSPGKWLKERESSGKYRLTDRIDLIIRYAPRYKTQWWGHLVLVRPRFTLEIPVLIAPDRIIFTPFISQYHIYRKERHANTNPSLHPD